MGSPVPAAQERSDLSRLLPAGLVGATQPKFTPSADLAISMREETQLELIKTFMVALAPEVVRHNLSLLRHHRITLELDEEGLLEHTALAIENSKLTLELSMHLAAQYGSCYDSLKSEAYTP